MSKTVPAFLAAILGSIFLLPGAVSTSGNPDLRLIELYAQKRAVEVVAAQATTPEAKRGIEEKRQIIFEQISENLHALTEKGREESAASSQKIISVCEEYLSDKIDIPGDAVAKIHDICAPYIK